MGSSNVMNTPISAFSRVENAGEIAQLRGGNAAALDGENDLLRFSGIVVVEVEPAVDAAIRAFLLIGGPRANLAERPPLELILVFFGQLGRPSEVSWLADHVVGAAISGPKASEGAS